jgi:outer membrane protein OmpA-like peptidoglycan-associated protein
MVRSFLLSILILTLVEQSVAQGDTVYLKNPSFEDVPEQSAKNIEKWYDCGKLNFPGESAPDIHPGKFWDNNLPASDKATYLGLVVRDNATYESVSQRLDTMLMAGKCYRFTINLAKAANYKSRSHARGDTVLVNYTTPAVLRIWGGYGFCGVNELLAESKPVSNESWQIYNFEFRPKYNVRAITLQAYFKTPTLMPYNGNILVDGASPIVRVLCPGEIAVAKPKTNLPPHKRNKQNTPPTPGKKPDTAVAATTQTPVPKILTELNKNTIKVGQTIEIKSLEFAADTSAISKTSYLVLDELFLFLKANPNLEIEIGGHTNNVPTDAYCDRLSTSRAKVVAEYLVNRGLNSEKIQFKGYGKRKPKADNRTSVGRKANQRVEIKIISLS